LGKVVKDEEIELAAKRIRILNARGDSKKAESELKKLKESKKKDNWTIESWKERFDEDIEQSEIDDTNSSNKEFNKSIDKAVESLLSKEQTPPAAPKAQPVAEKKEEKPAPKEEKVTPKLKDYKIKPPSDNVSEVAQSSGLTAGKKNTTKPISELSGGVDLKQEKERRRVDKLKEEITSEGGYISRLIVNKDGEVIEGQHRLEALRELGFTEVPVVELLGPDDFISDVIGLRKAIEDAGLKSVTSQNELVDNITEILVDEKGDVSQLEFYEAPKGYEKPWFAAVKFLTQQQPSTPSTKELASQVEDMRSLPPAKRKAAQQALEERYGKEDVAKMIEITANFTKIIDDLEKRGVVKIDCP
jgi:ParB-like chromosome segregation protein Spo0J